MMSHTTAEGVRIDQPGSLSGPMILSRIASIEMTVKGLKYLIESGARWLRHKTMTELRALTNNRLESL